MRHAFHFCPCIFLLVWIPAQADDKGAIAKAADKDKKEETKHKDDKLSSAIVVRVKVARVENAHRQLTVDVPYTVKTGTYSFGVRFRQVEMQANDDIKVRMLNPPVDFDLKGKPRKYTSKELKELKGVDTKLPGYTADFDGIKPGQIVDVYLPGKAKPLAKPPPGKVLDPEEPKPVDKPEVLMVVIVQEPPQ
jgi:hypothetical protein